MCRRNVRSPTPSNRAASSWLSRPPRQPPYASSNLIIRVSCRHSVRLIATSSEVAMKTGQITCYNPGQIMCSQQTRPAGVDKMPSNAYDLTIEEPRLEGGVLRPLRYFSLFAFVRLDPAPRVGDCGAFCGSQTP